MRANKDPTPESEVYIVCRWDLDYWEPIDEAPTYEGALKLLREQVERDEDYLRNNPHNEQYCICAPISTHSVTATPRKSAIKIDSTEWEY
jgi:hypothetical protein